jgi:hypothetical protein
MARESITSSVNIGVAQRRAATQYGRRLEEAKALASYTQEGGKVIMETTFPYNDLPGFVLSDELYNYLPVGVKILSAGLVVTKTFLGGTSLAVGTNGVDDGAVVDADGLITDANAPLANLVAGNFIVGTGAQLNTLAGTTEKLHIKVTATGTFTAGEATLRVEYQLPIDRYNVANG